MTGIIKTVKFTEQGKEDYEKHKSQKVVRVKTDEWRTQVETYGLQWVRDNISKWHDHLIKDKGTRAIRLNRKWRLEYTHDGQIVSIEEIHPHDY